MTIKPDFNKIIEQTCAWNWNVHDEHKNLSISELTGVMDASRLPYAVCALNLAGDLNVGMIMRTACIMGAERLIIFGRRRYDKRSTVGAQNYIPVSRIGGLHDDLSYDVEAFDATMQHWNYQPVFIETGGTDIDAMDWKSLNPKPCLIFGNEGQGCPEYLMRDHARVSINQRGVLRSLNVAVAAGIACHSISNALRS
jgi:tRNA G18 (ribose-2'-O)-methylase SpoU